jgi:hypothetical protein
MRLETHFQWGLRRECLLVFPLGENLLICMYDVLQSF